MPRRSPSSARAPRVPAAALPTVALFASGYQAPYLLPTLVGRLGTDFGLTPTQAGGVGSTLLLASAAAGFTLSSRVAAIGAVRLARIGLLLLALGFGLAAAAPAGALPLLVVGCVLGGVGSGTVTAVAVAGISGHPDPHRSTALGLLVTSALAAGLYLALPHLGGGHALPFGCIAGWALLSLTWAGRVDGPDRAAPVARSARGPLPVRGAGAVLAGGLLLWSLAQNALWGVSGRIGLDRAGLSEALLGLVFATALGAGLLGTALAGSLGTRIGRAVPIGAGTAVIALCVAVSATARRAAPFALGEISWNAVFPFVLSYLLGAAALLDAEGRWAVLVGSASSLGVACGPIVGMLLSVHAGYGAMGLLLGTLLLLLAAPLAAVARRVDRPTPTHPFPHVPPA